MRQHFAGSFGFAINALRIRIIVFLVRDSGSPVKHVIRTDVDQLGANLFGCSHHIPCADRIYSVGSVYIGFGGIHRGIGCTMDDRIGLESAYNLLALLQVRDVQFSAAAPHDVVPLFLKKSDYILP